MASVLFQPRNLQNLDERIVPSSNYQHEVNVQQPSENVSEGKQGSPKRLCSTESQPGCLGVKSISWLKII